ncbi:hypothetical protein MUP79_10265 [Candidatus Bathyarchaeota archaeon]|nr:hypothetical protein [Candidatus Bathyarchaeota archaeon]
MAKIIDIRGIVEISGFGKRTSYEKGCQTMLQAGWEWLNKNKNPKLKGHTYRGIYGIFEPDNKASKELSKVICKAVNDGCTGAMHQAVFGHLMYMNANGIDKWKKEVVKK